MIALFDLDGVIIDTEPQYKIFWDRMGLEYLGRENFQETIKGQTLTQIFAGNFSGMDKEQKEIVARLNEFEEGMHYDYVPGVYEFILELRSREVPMAIVTSSNEMKMNQVKKVHPELWELMDAVITSEDFSRSKPDPECFLKGMEALDGTPGETYVFEDSVHGANAGKAAGANVIGLATTLPREVLEPLCDAVIDDFTGFSLPSLQSESTLPHTEHPARHTELPLRHPEPDSGPLRQLVFATGNPGKLREASEILGDGFSLVSLAQAGITEEIPETGETLLENSIQKADYLYGRSRCDCFADDTGLEVDALGGAPGVYTARYAGDDKDFDKNMDKVLYELERLEAEASRDDAAQPVSRRARFKSVITLIVNGEKKIFEGTLEGVIAREKSGNGGFGYDPIFVADEFPGLTLADISEDEKNAISHRGKALRAMAEWLKTQNS